ncbi:MAG: hypothetical protein ACKOTB_03485, partial [Planctomycetia bacterium]
MNEPAPPFDVDTARALLGLRRPVPTTLPGMVRCLRVTFVPGTRLTPRLRTFGERLRKAFAELGVREIPFSEALTAGERLADGVVPIAVGETQFDVLALGHVPRSSLSNSPSVGIFDGRCPISEESSLQAKLDAIVSVMATHLVSLCVFVTDSTWVMCTMNGGIATFSNGDSLTDDVLRALVPKLAARVAVPRTSDMECRHGGFSLSSPVMRRHIGDLQAGAGVWAQGGLMNAHATLDGFTFKSPLHRLLVDSFVDHRNGMSFGFLARQLPVAFDPAVVVAKASRQIADMSREGGSLQEIDGRPHLVVKRAGERFLVPVPEVSVLCTRSGCEKTRLVPENDLVRLTLSNAEVIMDTPEEGTHADDWKPSYDTYTILAGALGNCIVASVLAALGKGAMFQDALRRDGLAFSHWHDLLAADEVPPGYVRHGAENPGVSCGTHQAAVYALFGKIEALSRALDRGVDYRGDVQIEPHHGTNMVGT